MRRQRGRVLQIVDYTFDPMSQVNTIEIDQYSKFLTAELEIGDELRLMDRRERIYCLDFNHDKVFHKEIQSISNVQSDFSINEWERNLGENFQAFIS